MRLIDADALIKRLAYCVKQGMGATIAYTFMHMIDDVPTIDAVSVVRCKDCKYKYMYKSVWACPYGLMITSDGYCNYGEREGE